MNDFMIYFSDAFHLVIDKGKPFILLAISIYIWVTAFKLFRILMRGGCRVRPVSSASSRAPYVSPVLEFEHCPVSSDCSKCRFYNSSYCIGGYMF